MQRLEKSWRIQPRPSDHEIDSLKSAINASEPLAVLLHQRGITDFEKARTFFNPSLNSLHPPSLMKDMSVAVQRICDAIEEEQHIMVYGDYDVDGTSSVALMYSFLMERYDCVSYYLPDRYKEGYGISFTGIDYAEDNDVELVIALDCGIKALEQIEYASKKGIDFIICDHHLPGESIPDAKAILNPLQTDCSYPDKHLSGCAIGFKLIQALTLAWDLDASEPYKYLDLVAIAAACDIVPLVGENRILCHFGIQLIEEAMRPGILSLLTDAGRIVDGRLKKSITIGDIVFAIGPRINAAGRMEHGQMAVRLLTAQTEKEAEEPAARINENNKNRREVDQQMLEEAIDMLGAVETSKNSTVLFAPHWHKGVVGIVASRVQDHRYRPTVILTKSEDTISGSARSVQGFDVHEAIESCSDLLINFGGHRAAAGLTMSKEKLPEFIERFEQAVSKRISPEQLIPSIDVDLEINLDQIGSKFFETMSRMAPFGPRNMRPTFVTRGLVDTGNTRCVGDGSHLKLEVKQGSKVMNGIAFGMGDCLSLLQSAPVDIVYTLELNEFRGTKSIELMIKDIKPS